MFLPLAFISLLGRTLEVEQLAAWLIAFQYMRALQQVDFGITGVSVRTLSPFMNCDFTVDGSAKPYIKRIILLLAIFGLVSSSICTFLFINNEALSTVLLYAIFHLMLTYVLKTTPIFFSSLNKYYVTDSIMLAKGICTFLVILLIKPFTWIGVFYYYFGTILIIDCALIIILLKNVRFTPAKNVSTEYNKDLLWKAFRVSSLITLSVLIQKLVLTNLQANHLSAGAVVAVAIPLLIYNSISNFANMPARWANSIYAKLGEEGHRLTGEKKATILIDLSFMLIALTAFLFMVVSDFILPKWLPNLPDEQIRIILYVCFVLIVALPFKVGANLYRNLLQARVRFRLIWIAEVICNVVPFIPFFLGVKVTPETISLSILISQAFRLISMYTLLKVNFRFYSGFRIIFRFISLHAVLLFNYFYQYETIIVLEFCVVLLIFIFYITKNRNTVF